MGQRAGRFDFGLHVGEHPLNGLIVGDGLAEGFALLGVFRRGFERALRQAHRLRGDADSAAIERFEGDAQALPFFAEAVFDRHAAILQRNFGGARKAQTHFVFVAADAESGKIGLHQKGGDAARAGVRVGLGKNQVDAGNAAVGDPGFGAVQQVMIAVAGGASLNSGGVGAGLWFGEAKCTEDFAFGQTGQIFFLLGVGAGSQERHADDGIGDAECDRGGGVDARDFFQHQRVADRIGSGAAPFVGDQHAAAAEFPEPADFLGGKFLVAFVFAQDRPHFRLHELADGVADQDLVAAK